MYFCIFRTTTDDVSKESSTSVYVDKADVTWTPSVDWSEWSDDEDDISDESDLDESNMVE